MDTSIHKTFRGELISLSPTAGYSLSRKTRDIIFGSLVLVTSLIAFGFTWFGAWLVLPYAGLEVVVIFFAWRWLRRHEGDFESLSVEGNTIFIEREIGNKVEVYEFNTIWLQVILEDRSSSGRIRLKLRSHGKDLEIGKLLSDNAKKGLAGRLRRLISKRY